MLGSLDVPPEKDWRASPDEAGNAALQYSDLAIGYLRRNSRYLAAYHRALMRVKRGDITADAATAALVRRWGISFRAEPSSAFDALCVVARADLSPDHVVLASAPPDIGMAQPLDIGSLPAVRARMNLDGNVHIILGDREGDAHLWVLGSPAQPLAVMLPLGTDLAVRLASAERLRRLFRGLSGGAPPLRPPPSRRRHLLTLLQVLDGCAAGASRRELAASLIDVEVRRFSAAEWADSRERKRISRWLAEAVELRDGGYIRLLRGG